MHASDPGALHGQPSTPRAPVPVATHPAPVSDGPTSTGEESASACAASVVAASVVAASVVAASVVSEAEKDEPPQAVTRHRSVAGHRSEARYVVRIMSSLRVLRACVDWSEPGADGTFRKFTIRVVAHVRLCRGTLSCLSCLSCRLRVVCSVEGDAPTAGQGA